MFSPKLWTGNSFGEPDIQTSLECFEDANNQPLPILDVFATSTVKAVLKDSAAVARLRQFTHASGSIKDIDFLLQIAEFSEGISRVASTVSSIAQKFTNVSASSPVKLPPAVNRNLNGNIREVSSTLLPNLECLFEDAKGFVEQSLAQDVYPDFLKHQLSLSLQTIGPCYSPNQVCPGFGEAFFITDSSEKGDPMVYASAGLANLTGYTIGEMIFKDCRMFQGPATRSSRTDRLRDGLSKNNEFTELVLNYTKEGRMYWNLMFMARLVGPEGEVQYHLGGQIDVTEMLERQEGITHVLSYVPPLPERPPEMPAEQDRRTSWRGGLKEKRYDREREAQPKYPPSVSRNRFLKSFRRRSSQLDFPGAETESVASEPSTPKDSRKSMTFPFSSPTSSHHIVLSPYSRFMVLEYIKPSKFGGPYDKKTNRVQLPLAFCSMAALESFGTGIRNVASVVGLNIFDVLSEKARSSSVTTSFKSTVRASLAEGRTAKLDIRLGGSHRNRSRGLSLSRKHSAVGLTSPASEVSSENGRPLRRSFSLERLVTSSSGSNTAEDFVSYWTPLKNDLGAIQWAVVVLVPDVA